MGKRRAEEMRALRLKAEAMMRDEKPTIMEIVRRLQSSELTVRRWAKAAGYTPPAEAVAAARSVGLAKGNAAKLATSKKAKLLEALRADPTLPVSTAAKQIGLDPTHARRCAESAGLTEGRPYAVRMIVLPPPRPKKVAPPPLLQQDGRPKHEGMAQLANLRLVTNYARSAESKEEGYRITAKAQRMAQLPPVTQDEADRLVADFIARKGVTVCPAPPSPEMPGNLGVGFGLSTRWPNA